MTSEQSEVCRRNAVSGALCRASRLASHARTHSSRLRETPEREGGRPGQAPASVSRWGHRPSVTAGHCGPWASQNSVALTPPASTVARRNLLSPSVVSPECPPAPLFPRVLMGAAVAELCQVTRPASLSPRVCSSSTLPPPRTAERQAPTSQRLCLRLQFFLSPLPFGRDSLGHFPSSSPKPEPLLAWGPQLTRAAGLPAGLQAPLLPDGWHPVRHRWPLSTPSCNLIMVSLIKTHLSGI